MPLLQTEKFVPLTTAAPAPGDPQEFRVTVVSGTDPARAFKTLEPVAAPADSGPRPGKVCEPRVSIQRDGDRITHLRIQCTCGQVMNLACLYEPAKPT